LTKYINTSNELKNIVEIHGKEIFLLLKDDENFPDENLVNDMNKEIHDEENEIFFYINDWNKRPKKVWRDIIVHNVDKIDNVTFERFIFSLLPINCRILKMERDYIIDENYEEYTEVEVIKCSFNSTLAIVKLIWASRNYRFKCINSWRPVCAYRK